MVSIFAFIAVLLLCLQRRRAQEIQAENANLVARTEGLTGVNPMRPGSQASLNNGPSVAELSTIPSFRPFSSELELGNSRLSRAELDDLTLSRQELSAERFPNQELGNSTQVRQELGNLTGFFNRELVGRSGGPPLSRKAD